MEQVNQQSPLKVLHVIDSGGLYGAEMMLLNLVSEQIKLGLSPIIASIGTPHQAKKPIEVEAEKRQLPLKIFRFRPGMNFNGASQIISYAHEQNVSLLHSHGYKGNVLLGLIPRFVRRLPVLSTLHGWTWTGQLNRMAVYETLDAIALRFVDHIVLVNQAMLEKKRASLLPRQRCSVISNGIDLGCDSGNMWDNIPLYHQQFIKRKFTLVSVGRLSREKNHVTLLQVLKDLLIEGLEVQLLILGDGYLKNELSCFVSDNSLNDSVLFAGHVDNVSSYLKYCQLFVMPSLTEGLPISMLEAMNMQIPIVASRVGGIPDLLKNGEAGVLIDPHDKQGLLQAIKKAYRDENSCLPNIKAAKNIVENHYSSRAMAEQYHQLYSKVLYS